MHFIQPWAPAPSRGNHNLDVTAPAPSHTENFRRWKTGTTVLSRLFQMSPFIREDDILVFSAKGSFETDESKQ